MKSLGIVIVSYGHEELIASLVKTILPQLDEDDRVVVVDNKKPWVITAEDFADDRVTVVAHDNGGFAAGCNEGVRHVGTDLVFLLNPDTVIRDDNLIETIKQAADTYPQYPVFMPYLLLEDGSVNSAGNALHISGLSWVNGLGTYPQGKGMSDIAIASGACLVTHRSWWMRLGGMTEEYFMYHEDTDFSARTLLAGGKVGLLRDAAVHHAYDYAKGDWKWIYIERNRVLFALTVWPALVVALLMPQLIAIEVALWAVAIKQGRVKLKRKSVALLAKDIPQLRRLRRKAAAQRTISSRQFFQSMSWALDNPHLGIESPVVTKAYGLYYRLCGFLLR